MGRLLRKLALSSATMALAIAVTILSLRWRLSTMARGQWLIENSRGLRGEFLRLAVRGYNLRLPARRRRVLSM